MRDILDNYMTLHMALVTIDAPTDQDTRLRRILKDNPDIKVIKIGKTTLINRKHFASVAGVRASERFPPHIGTVGIENLVSVKDAAKILGVSTNAISMLLARFKLDHVDLTPWHGSRLPLKSATNKEKTRREFEKRMRTLKKKPRYKNVTTDA